VSSRGVLQRAKFVFAHESTLVPFKALLRLDADVSPLSINSSATSPRNFRMSTVSPFATNLAFVLYNCSSSSSSSSSTDEENFEEQEETNVYSVRLLVNEKPRTFPGCSADPCPLDELFDIYDEALQIDFDAVCKTKPPEYSEYITVNGRILLFSTWGFLIVGSCSVFLFLIGFIFGRLSKKQKSSSKYSPQVDDDLDDTRL